MSRTQLALALFTALFGLSNAKAQTFGSWTVDDKANPCIARTKQKLGAQTLFLEVALDKSGTFPVEIYLRHQGPAPLTGSFRAVLDASKGIRYAFPLQDAASQVYWGLPRNTDQLITFIRQQNSLLVQYTDGSKVTPVSFSLSGSSKSMDVLAQKCHPSKNLSVSDFEKSFLPPSVTQVDPARVTVDLTNELRSLYHQGYRSHLQGVSLDRQLQTLRDQFKKQLSDFEIVDKQLATLKGTTLPALEQRIATNDRDEQTAQNQRSQAQVDQSQAQADLPAAQSALQSAEQALAPLKPDHDRLAALVQNAEADLNRSQSRSRAIDQRLARLDSELVQLNAELNQSRTDLARAEAALGPAERELAEAQRNNSRYDVNFEIDSKLRSDFSYRNAKMDEERLEREVRQLESQMFRLRSEVQRQESELRRCQSQPNAQCAREESEVRRAESELRNAQSQLQTAEWRLRSAQSDVQRAEMRVREEVLSEKRRLQSREDQAQSQVLGLRSRARQLESRVRDISQTQIPLRQNEMANLRTEKTQLQGEIRNIEGELSRRRADLESWKRSVGYDHFLAARDGARSRVQELQGKISGAADLIAKSDKKIKECQALRPQLADQRQKLMAQIAQLESRRLALESELANFRKQETENRNQRAQADQQLESLRLMFTQKVP